MAIQKVKYKEPASYFTPEMLRVAEKWDREHKQKKPAGASADTKKEKKK